MLVTKHHSTSLTTECKQGNKFRYVLEHLFDLVDQCDEPTFSSVFRIGMCCSRQASFFALGWWQPPDLEQAVPSVGPLLFMVVLTSCCTKSRLRVRPLGWELSHGKAWHHYHSLLKLVLLASSHCWAPRTRLLASQLPSLPCLAQLLPGSEMCSGFPRSLTAHHCLSAVVPSEYHFSPCHSWMQGTYWWSLFSHIPFCRSLI